MPGGMATWSAESTRTPLIWLRGVGGGGGGRGGGVSGWGIFFPQALFTCSLQNSLFPQIPSVNIAPSKNLTYPSTLGGRCPKRRGALHDIPKTLKRHEGKRGGDLKNKCASCGEKEKPPGIEHVFSVSGVVGGGSGGGPSAGQLARHLAGPPIRPGHRSRGRATDQSARALRCAGASDAGTAVAPCVYGRTTR